ncbi:MAG: hypothetical protein K2Z80_30995 [Xanthobacteraceae bacterium]|nr:hypothetical protein [Xanthobacteraceae bacterium]
MAEVANSIIDFTHSRLTWATMAGSCGHWRIIAIASRLGSGGHIVERFVLAPGVMAGDVYGAGRLMREPPYSFQIFASDSHHVIVREPCGSAPRTIVADTIAQNTTGFAALEIQIAQTDVVPIEPEWIDDEAVTAHWPLTAEVEMVASDGNRWQLVFPVNHLNTATVGGEPAFQVESGPVLVPQTLIGNRSAFVGRGLALAYAYFNRTDRIDLALWGPHSREPSRAFQHFDRIEPAAVTIFGSARTQG